MDFSQSSFPSDDTFLIPLGHFGPFDPREPTANNQLTGPALPLQADIRDNEELLLEEDPFLQDAHTCSAVSAAGPLDIEPHPFNNDSLTVSSSAGEDNSGPPTFPTQISGTSNHGPMTPQAQQGILVPEYPVKVNDDIKLETGQDSKLWCPDCGKTFYSTGVRNRHWDDVHSAPQKCPRSECNTKLKGKRALKYHLSVHHKEVPPN